MSILQTEDATFETEIEGCITSADAFIDSELDKYDLTVPSSTPQVITDASAHFAAWLFRHRRDPTGAAAFKEEAEVFLQSYIECETEVAFRVVSDQ
jgi:hypothetical protein